ncbi:MAG: hypothetical protein AAFX87_03535 [Bacteroidota bacterium]
MRFYFTALFFSLLVLATSCTEEPMTESEKSILVTAKDFEDYGFRFANADSIGIFTKTTFFDGSIELDYEFEYLDDDENAMYLSHTISLEKNAADATATYAGESIGTSVGLLTGVEFEELDHVFSYGDKSSFNLLRSEGYPIGNFFHYRKGSYVYTLWISGVYFDDRSSWETFIMPKIKVMENFKR